MSVQFGEEGSGEPPEVRNPCRGPKNGEILNWTRRACAFSGMDYVVLRHVTPMWAFVSLNVCFFRKKQHRYAFKVKRGNELR